MAAVSITSSGRKLMAAVPPDASCALATRLMVTKFVKDCASGVVSRTRVVAVSIRWRRSSICGWAAPDCDAAVFGVGTTGAVAGGVGDDPMTGQMRRSRSCAAPYDGSNQQVLRVRRHAFLSLAFRFGSPALHYGCHARVRRGHGALLRLPFRTAYFGMRYCGYGGLAVASCGARHPRISQNRGISTMRHCCPNPPDCLVPWLLFHTTRITRATARCGTEEPVQH